MFKRDRHPVDIEYGGEKSRLYARELGYGRFRDICAGTFPEPRWQRVMEAVTVASVETEDGRLAFTAETWPDVPRGPAEALLKAAWKAQGVDVDKEPEAGAESAGNG